MACTASHFNLYNTRRKTHQHLNTIVMGMGPVRLLLHCTLLAALASLPRAQAQLSFWDQTLPLRVGIINPKTLPFFPMVYMEGQAITGFDVEVVGHVLERLGLDTTNETHVQFIYLDTLDDRMTYLETDQADLTVGVLSVTEARKERVSFVAPYYYASGIALALSKSDPNPARFSGGWETIRGSTICLIEGAYYAPTLSDYGAVLFYVQERSDLQKRVHSGDCVAAAIDSTDGQLAARDLQRAVGLEPIMYLPYAIAVSKNNPGLQTLLAGALVDLMKDGRDSTIFQVEKKFFYDNLVGCVGPSCEPVDSFQPLQALVDQVKVISSMFPGNWTVSYSDTPGLT